MHFVDTNVLIGFYTGATSYEEYIGLDGCGGKCKTKESQISREFRRAAVFLKKGKSIDDLISHAGEKNWQIISCIQFLNEAPQEETNFQKEIKSLQGRFLEICRNNRIEIENKVQIHHRYKSYAELYTLLSEVCSDYDDIEVILDAHDFCCDNIIRSFITGDFKHIISIKKIIEENTAIPRIEKLSNWNCSASTSPATFREK